ncbi:MAG TPA: hypothetical protein PLD10_00775 [Rhodopila sp.]|nr:hypothetical protein [Rhodopila sp.]
MEILRTVLGLDLPDEELSHLLVAYEAIHQEIQKLRTLDLTDTHPAVIYDPLLPYCGGAA